MTIVGTSHFIFQSLGWNWGGTFVFISLFPYLDGWWRPGCCSAPQSLRGHCKAENPVGTTSCWGLWGGCSSSVAKRSFLGPLLLNLAVCISCTGLILYFTPAQLRRLFPFVFMDLYFPGTLPVHFCQKGGPFHSDSVEIGSGLYWVLISGGKGRCFYLMRMYLTRAIWLAFCCLASWPGEGVKRNCLIWLLKLLWVTEKSR